MQYSSPSTNIRAFINMVDDMLAQADARKVSRAEFHIRCLEWMMDNNLALVSRDLINLNPTQQALADMETLERNIRETSVESRVRRSTVSAGRPAEEPPANPPQQELPQILRRGPATQTEGEGTPIPNTLERFGIKRE